MTVAHKVAEVRAAMRDARRAGGRTGFVPTMGDLHAGHLALIQKAKTECDFVVVSIFVNPTQFGPGDDFERYRRAVDDDLRVCEREGADLVFLPSVEEVYPEGYGVEVHVPPLEETWEGEFRPGHFVGVATVVLKLFNIVGPDVAYFGMKDYQQLVLIRTMVRNLNLPVEIVPVETVREPDGLALSSRNRYLSDEERQQATPISLALRHGKAMVEAGEQDPEPIRQAVHDTMSQVGLKVQYVAVVDPERMEPMEVVGRPVLIAVAALCGTTRLIDNVLIE